MLKRFSRLNYALKTLRNPAQADVEVDITPPTNTILHKFHTRRTRNIEYPRAATSKPGQYLDKKLNPFAFDNNADNNVKVFLSSRVSTNTAINAVRNKCNYTDFVLPADADVRGLLNFHPAQTIVRVQGTTATTETSKITGVKYTKKSASSYSIPTGSSSTKNVWAEVVEDILTLESATLKMSFKPEVYRPYNQ